MGIAPAAISRLASHALRHEPGSYGLSLDAEGWVEIDELLTALHAQGPEWFEVDRASLELMIATSAKKRHEIKGDRIRALYGHSVTAEINYVEGVPPEILFHGTSALAWESIRVEGLRPMNRQRVHLAVDVETATAVGSRKDSSPMILAVRAQDAQLAGSTFWIANETIWLSDHVPASYLTLSDR